MAESDNYGKDWTDDECRLLVADYFAMLEEDRRGVSLNKTEHRIRLLAQIDRTEGSIEFKHQNVSAVLEVLGLEWIPGYRPADNFQNSLVAAVEHFLQGNKEFISTEPATPLGFSESARLFIEAPPLLMPTKKKLPDFVERLVQRFDPVERDFRNRTLGEAGEKLVFEAEVGDLVTAGRMDLAKRVSWASKELGDGLGYDIASFDTGGREKFIEVKTTVGSNRTPFFMTRNEKSFAEEADDRYSIRRLYDFRRQPKAFELSPPLENHLFFRTEVFRASFDNISVGAAS